MLIDILIGFMDILFWGDLLATSPIYIIGKDTWISMVYYFLRLWSCIPMII
jgi:hypothetical protein